MNRYIIGSLWDRVNRNGANANFEYLFEGRQKIDELNYRAEGILTEAQQTNVMNKDVQNQLDNLIIESGNANAEVSQARGDAPLLKDRLDKTDSQLANSVEYTDSSTGKLRKRMHGKTAQISFIVDDGSIADYNKLKPIFENKGFSAGLGIVTNWANTTGSYMTWEQIREMVKIGCEIYSHSVTHRNFTTLSKSELYEEFSESKRILRERGFNPRGFVYPFNATSLDSRDVLTKYYEVGFAKVGYGNGAEGLNTPNLFNYEIGRNALGSYFDVPRAGFPQDTSSLEYYKALVDDAISKNNWLVFVMHSEPMDAVQLKHLEDTVDYARLKGVPILNPSEGFDRYGNIIEIPGKFTMDANGDVDSTSILVQRYGTNARSVKDPYTLFRNSKKSYVNITAAYAIAEGFPSGLPGVFITDRITGTENGVRQEYRVSAATTNHGRPRVYERYLRNDGTWTDFTMVVSGAIRFDKTTPLFTIDAGKTLDLEITGLDGLIASDVVSITPFNDTLIKSGIIYHLLSYGLGKIKIRFANITGASITNDSLRWRINSKFTE